MTGPKGNAEPGEGTRQVERLRRERKIWNEGGIVAAQHRYKRRLLAGFQNPHSRSRSQHRERVIREACAGAQVLDVGCFDGVDVQRCLDYGAARVVGVDISDEAVGRAKARIRDPRAELLVGDAHALPFADGSFDLVIGRAILHHLQLHRAYREIARLLRPGGLATFVEPLRGNPGARVARLLTPGARTPDELPLSRADIRAGDEIIGPGTHEFSGVVSTPVGLLTSLLGGGKDGPVMRLAARGDDALERTPLRYWGRTVFLYWHKRG